MFTDQPTPRLNGGTVVMQEKTAQIRVVLHPLTDKPTPRSNGGRMPAAEQIRVKVKVLGSMCYCTHR